MPDTITKILDINDWIDITFGIVSGFFENNSGHPIVFLQQSTKPDASNIDGIRLNPHDKQYFFLPNSDRIWARGKVKNGRVLITPGMNLSTVKIADGPDADGFGRLRVGNPISIWDNKNIHDSRINHWEEIVSGGGSISFNANESSVDLDVGTANGDVAIRQTLRYFAYVPGRSQDITITGVLNVAKPNLTQRIGYFDDNNGLFFELADSILSVVIRTATSGTPVDTTTIQSNWNLDTLDGSGDENNPSGLNLDITKAQIFKVDFQWLGVGRVRFGFNLGGKTLYVHEVLNANVADKVYITTPSLPIRYEIKNTGITASASKLKEICNSVDSEGGHQLPGYQYSCSNGITARSISARTPILAFRLVNTINGKPNRRTARFLAGHFYVGGTVDVFFEVVRLQTPIVDVGGSWVTTGINGSGCEYNTGLTSLTGGVEHTTHPVYVPSGQGSSAESKNVASQFVTEHNFIAQNFNNNDSQVFAVFATPLSAVAIVAAGLEWMEFD